MENILEKRIAILGGGASAVSILYSLNKVIDRSIDCKINIDIYEPNEELGRGLAYVKDSKFIKLNRPPKDMSIDSQNDKHFYSWVKNNAKEFYEQSEFLPRNVYGKYLHETYIETTKSLSEKNYFVNHIKEKVQRIRQINDELYEVQSNKKRGEIYNYIVLAIGGTTNKDPYYLNDNSNYINEPYPLVEKLEFIKSDDKVGIIGSGLTAIDVFLYLKKQKDFKQYTMLSRSGKLPSVRGIDTKIELHYLKKENINLSEIRMDKILALFLKEFEIRNISWREVFLRKNDVENYTTFSKKTLAAKKNNLWFDILRETHPIIDKIWIHLSDKEKEYFVKKILPKYITRRAAIPLINAEEILESLNTKELNVVGGLQRIEHSKSKFKASFLNSKNQEYDVIINATGLSNDISNDLIETMIKDNLINVHIAGGIKVDFNTGSVISSGNKKNSNIKAIGHITSGNYFVTNNLEFIANRSYVLAGDLVKLIENSSRIDGKKPFLNIPTRNLV